MAQKMEVQIESRQIADLKKSNHQDTLKVISAMNDIRKAIDNLGYQIKRIGEEFGDFREAYDSVETDE